MSQKAGLWIDHRKAVILLVSGDGEEMKTIDSGMAKRVRFRAAMVQRMARLRMCVTGNLETTSITFMMK